MAKKTIKEQIADLAVITERLDGVVSILSGIHRLRLIPGPQWAWNLATRQIMYPRATLLDLGLTKAVGYLWRTVQHAISTRGDLSPYDVAVDTVLAAELRVGARTMHPAWILDIMGAAERERVERIARSAARNLGATYLPPRGSGYRADEPAADLKKLATPVTDEASYWKRVAVAITGLTAGTLAPTDLPADMPWIPSTLAQIAALPTLPTYDALLEAVEALVPDLAVARAITLQQPKPEESEDESENDAADESTPAPDPNGEDNADEDTHDDCDESTEPGADADENSEAPDEPKDDTGGQADNTSEDDDLPHDSADNSTGNDESSAPTDSDSAPPPSADDNESMSDDHSSSTPSPSDKEDDTVSDDGTSTGGDSGDNTATQQTSNPNDHLGEEPESNPNADPTPQPKPTNAQLDPEAPDTIDVYDLDSTRISDEILDAIIEEIEKIKDSTTEIDYAADPDGTTLIEKAEAIARVLTPEMLAETNYDAPPPEWNAVARVSAPLIARVRRTLLAHLVENEIGQIVHGTTSGAIDIRLAQRPGRAQTTPPFARRSEPDEHSYAFALVLDRSGSMYDATAGDPFPEAFGPGALQRWHLTARLAVAFTESLARLPGSKTTIITYDGQPTMAKRLNDKLDAPVKHTVMSTIHPHGSNDDAKALHKALAELQTSHADRKIIFHLTDGQFCSSHTAMTKVINQIRNTGVQLIILTLDIDPVFAREFVANHLVDRVDDNLLDRVLSKHLRRVLAA